MDVKHQPEFEEKVALEHVEGDATTRDAVLQETLKQAGSPWKALRQNLKAICVILAIQVSDFGARQTSPSYFDSHLFVVYPYSLMPSWWVSNSRCRVICSAFKPSVRSLGTTAKHKADIK